MVSILDEIIEYMKEYEFSVPIKDVRETYSPKSPVYPMVTVEETRNSPDLQLHGELIRSKLNYRFEIYGRDTSIGDTVLTKRQVVRKIGNDIDTIMRTKYGMKCISSPQILPYTTDNSVLRYIITYTGVIDTRTMIIYQK